MIATSALIKLAIFFSFASAVPLPEIHAGGSLAARAGCPKLTSLPLHWDAAAQPVRTCGWTTCLPWNKNKQQSIPITSNAYESDGLECVYNLQSWNGQPAYVVTPKKTGSKTDERNRYNRYVEIHTKLGRVLAQTRNGRPAAVLSPAAGSRIQNTQDWMEMIPSDRAFRKCAKFVADARKLVVARIAQYAMTNGVLYDTDHFTIANTRWTEDWSQVELNGWAPDQVKDSNQGQPSQSQLDMWAYDIANSDLRADGKGGLCEPFILAGEEGLDSEGSSAEWETEKSDESSDESSDSDSGSDSDDEYRYWDEQDKAVEKTNQAIKESRKKALYLSSLKNF